ncbi:MAG: DUF427 domain-containing protein [Hyphomicrobiales bacterium]|nr:DUF427 domain-containing protein [Hyphomicrobiales bacterium]
MITITPNPKRVVVRAGGAVIVDTTHALLLKEGGGAPVQYIPREDVTPGALVESQHTTRCPYKGLARYFHLNAGGKQVDNAVWSYEDPIEAAAAIKNHVAFYPNRVIISEE